MTAPNQSNWDRYEWDAWTRVWSGMSHTVWLIPYEWDTKLTVDTDMTETPWPKLAQIWLRRPKKICSRFSILHSYDCDTLQNNDQKILGRFSHICASLGQGVSVISVPTVSFVSHSYHSKLWFKRLTHIGLNLMALALSYSAPPMLEKGRLLRNFIRFPIILEVNFNWFCCVK